MGQLPEPGSEKEPSCFLFVQVGAVAVAVLMRMMMIPELCSSDAAWVFALLLLRRDAPRRTQTKR